MPNTVPTPTHDVRQQEGVYTPFPPNLSRIPTREEPQRTQEMEGAESLELNIGTMGACPPRLRGRWPVALTLSTASRLKTSRSGQGGNRTAEQEALPDLPDQGSSTQRGTGLQVLVEQAVLRRPRVQGRDGGRDEEKRERAAERAACRGLHLLQSPPAAREGEGTYQK